MFFPLHDDNPRERFPFITVALIAVNVLVWLVQIPMGNSEQAALLQAWAVVPENYSGGGGGPIMLPLITSLFMHGGLMHLAGNMWFLWLFGDNLEEDLGPFPYLVLYFLSGLGATFAHILASPHSSTPLIGASGAISGVMAGYMVLYPQVKVRVLIFLFRFARVVPVSAMAFMGLWIAFQVVMAAVSESGQGGGVAFMAHLGGFGAGLLLTLALKQFRSEKA